MTSFFMPLPLGAGGIMFSGCPSVRLSVWSLKYPLLTCTWVRWSTWPTVTMSVRPYVSPSVCPSGEVFGHLPENAWRELPEILHADVSWPLSALIMATVCWFFLILVLFWLSETSQIWGFRTFLGERMEEMAWNFACWCILTTFKTDQFWIKVRWFLKFWHYFDLVKWVRFGVSGHFLENALREWPEIWYATVSWPPLELISLWLLSGDFSNFGAILT